MRTLYLLIVACCLFFSSCRKDQLQPEGIERLNTHTTSDRLNKIIFINDSVGFVVGGNRFTNATILKTTDCGKSWSYQKFDDENNGIYGVHHASFGRLYTIGWMGMLNMSDDNGATWYQKRTRYEEYKDLAFANKDRGVAIGGISFITGYIMHIDAEGNVKHRDSLSHELNDIEPINEKTAYLCGYGVVYKSTDSLKTWTLLNIKNDNFTAIHAYANNVVWTCGYNGSIFYSNDGGEHWQKKRNGNDVKQPRYRLLDIAFADEAHGYAVGENGLLIYTDDGGNHWMEYKSFTKVHLRSLYIKKDRTVFICGDEGSLFMLPPRQ